MNKMNKLMKSVMGVVEEVSNLLAPRSCLLALTSSLLALLLPQAAEAQYIQETMTLTNGWNAIYLESTPENPACSDFFKDMPVTKVMLYRGSAYAEGPWLDENGRDILQPPVFYNVWIRKKEEFSTLTSLVGGRCYLVFATAPVASKTFLGVPASPYVYWHQVSDTANDLMNIAGVSCQTNVSAATYFKGGPANCQKVYEICGTNDASPNVRQLIGASPKLQNGRAYSLAADRDGAWPGVIGLVGWDELQVMGGYGTLRVRNNGITNRVFRMTMVKSAKDGEDFPPIQRLLPRTDIEADDIYSNIVAGVSWDASVAAGETELLQVKAGPSALAAGKTYAAVLEIEDLGGSGMRVRVPVSVVKSESPESVPFPTGVWGGTMAFDKVSTLTNSVPIPAAGVMALNVIMFVAPDGSVKLLQRATVAAISNGTGIVYRDLADVPTAEARKGARRLFTGMMSVDTPEVEAISDNGFGKKGDLTFAWDVPERARDNPFRHAWHPDHDGLSADYSTQLPTGDDFRNYAMPVKPELWSIGNVLALNFKSNLTQNADETAEGTVTWDVAGLVSTNTIHATGSYRIKRLIPVSVMKSYADGE